MSFPVMYRGRVSGAYAVFMNPPLGSTDASGNPLQRITINGEAFSYCDGGTMSGMLRRGTKGAPPWPGVPLGAAYPYVALWNPTDIELV
jgi:hypothetical protein